MLFANIIQKLNQAGVRYAIVGGIAVNLHGYVRATHDLDILLDMNDENIRKVIEILKGEGYACKLPVDPIGLADVATRRDWIENKNLKALNFFRDMDEVDLVIGSPIQFSDCDRTIKTAKGIGYPIVSKENLIVMKTGTPRRKDEIDIEQLKNLIEIEKTGSQS